MARIFLTTSIPYVNGTPHIGHALEFVQADVLARYYRQRGDEVRLQSGTDDHALKNVTAAEAAGVPTKAYVDSAAARFAELGHGLDLSVDDFLRTSADPRHRPGVDLLWTSCAHDLYQKSYSGLYCVGCEAFSTENRCPEHDTELEFIEERNWFFRLSKYATELEKLIESGRLRIVPKEREREVLGFIRSGLQDFSVSRDIERARGWGIPVPGDPSQVIYVWFDALANYLTGPGYGTDSATFEKWWANADQRIHVVGKGIVRFHAVYWPAILLSAGLRLPDTIYVHDYLTVNGRKISKSSGDSFTTHNVDALRWWLLADVARVGDTDFTAERLVSRYNEDLANTIGNLASRVAALTRKFPHSGQSDVDQKNLRDARDRCPGAVADALARFDFRAATQAVLAIAVEANRYLDATRPWADPTGAGLGEVREACEDIAVHLRPFLPSATDRTPLFPRLVQ